MEQLDRENEHFQNTKECQTEQPSVDASTQTDDTMTNFSVECLEKSTQTLEEIFDNNTDFQYSDSEVEAEYGFDTSDCIEDETESEEEEVTIQEDAYERPEKNAFIVYWPCLLVLL